ncbi:hypothetical protein BJ322DRAFT_1105462 [Thelephora terrestris]|uniref:Uncharacterized protein n=1 Tax=Thelephora terrestris TaxID=56493 RepID=A0A9P6HL27_9AGAM|nr:hypothetical protein BJ322DRAFT_1105462 [Thelephora terrestris]
MKSSACNIITPGTRPSCKMEQDLSLANRRVSNIFYGCSEAEIRGLVAGTSGWEKDLWGSGAVIHLRKNMEERLYQEEGVGEPWAHKGLVEPWAQNTWAWGSRCIARNRENRSAMNNNAEASLPLPGLAGVTVSPGGEGSAQHATIFHVDLASFALPTDLVVSLAQLELRRTELMALLHKEAEDVGKVVRRHAERMETMELIIANLSRAISQREVALAHHIREAEDGTEMLWGEGSDQDVGVEDVERDDGGFQDVVEEELDLDPLFQWGIKAVHVGVFGS